MGTFRTKDKERTLKYLDTIRNTIAQGTIEISNFDMLLESDADMVGRSNYVERKLTGRHHVWINLDYDVVE